MRRIVASIATVLVALTLGGATPNTGGGYDKFSLNVTGIRDSACNAVNGKTLASPTINPAIKNLVLITAGQSNSEAISPAAAFVPANPAALDNFNIYDGAIYKAVEPIVGAGCNGLGDGWIYYHFAMPLADALVTAGKFDRVIIAPISFGGSLMADWGSGVLSNRFSVLFDRLAQIGITQGINTTFVICWGQGEYDNQVGTSQASYVASFNAMWAAIQAKGYTGKILVAKETYLSGAASAAIQAAQTAAAPSGVINNANGIYLGAVSDALVGNTCNGGMACRQGDNTHFTPNGIIAYATDATNGWQKALANTGAPF